MNPLFDDDRLHNEAVNLALQSAAGQPLPLAEAQAKAREDLQVAAVLLGLSDVLGEEIGGDCAGLPDHVAFRLQDAQAVRADLLAALPGALRFARGEFGTDAAGRDAEDDAATVAFRVLGCGSLLSDTTASVQYLAGLPHN